MQRVMGVINFVFPQRLSGNMPAGAEESLRNIVAAAMWTVWPGIMATAESQPIVGTKAPNGLGIYDMSGNIWEWCEDIYADDAYSKNSRNNPIYADGGTFRVLWGGSWRDRPRNVRSADRYGLTLASGATTWASAS